jgi:Xaa-Pro aminopeptidase
LFYLCGVDQEDTRLVLFPDAPEEKNRELLFVRETNEHIAIWEGQKLSKEQATAVSGIKTVHWSTQFDGVFKSLMADAEHVYLNENDHLRASTRVQTRDARFIRSCREEYPLHHYERIAPLLHRLRMFKSPAEAALIRRACEITELGFRRVLGMIKPGVTEYEIEAEFAREFLRNRSRGFAYTPIIGSGANACVLHYVDNDRACADGELVLMDVAAEYANYNADLTRTVPVNGRFTPRQRAVYDAVLRVLRRCGELLRPGILVRDYQKKVEELMDEELANLGLLKTEEIRAQDPEKPARKKYFMHGVSHHLGLDVHDVHDRHQPVQPGMVFTIEPGIYIREENLGVRLENTVLIGEAANTDLMASIPIEADEIEALMRR